MKRTPETEHEACHFASVRLLHVLALCPYLLIVLSFIHHLLLFLSSSSKFSCFMLLAL